MCLGTSTMAAWHLRGISSQCARPMRARPHPWASPAQATTPQRPKEKGPGFQNQGLAPLTTCSVSTLVDGEPLPTLAAHHTHYPPTRSGSLPQRHMVRDRVRTTHVVPGVAFHLRLNRSVSKELHLFYSPPNWNILAEQMASGIPHTSCSGIGLP